VAAFSIAARRLPAWPFHTPVTTHVRSVPIQWKILIFRRIDGMSRSFRPLKLWLSLLHHGLAPFRASIAKDLSQASRLAQAVRNESQLELMAPVELSAVCFRHREAESEQKKN
jgi:hypothetical protein